MSSKGLLVHYRFSVKAIKVIKRWSAPRLISSCRSRPPCRPYRVLYPQDRPRRRPHRDRSAKARSAVLISHLIPRSSIRSLIILCFFFSIFLIFIFFFGRVLFLSRSGETDSRSCASAVELIVISGASRKFCRFQVRTVGSGKEYRYIYIEGLRT